MEELKERIKERFYLGNDSNTVANQIINEIIIPTVKEAFEAGRKAPRPDQEEWHSKLAEEWIEQKFK